MKVSEFRKLIREEVRKFISEATSVNSLNFDKFKLLFKLMQKDFENKLTQKKFISELNNLAKQAGIKNYNVNDTAYDFLDAIQDDDMSVTDAIKAFKKILNSGHENLSKTAWPEDIEFYDKNNKAITISLVHSDTILLRRIMPIQNLNHDKDKAVLIVNNVTPANIIDQFLKLKVVNKLNNKYILANKYTNYKLTELAKMLKNVTISD